jgi:hypothetical protein
MRDVRPGNISVGTIFLRSSLYALGKTFVVSPSAVFIVCSNVGTRVLAFVTEGLSIALIVVHEGKFIITTNAEAIIIFVFSRLMLAELLGIKRRLPRLMVLGGNASFTVGTLRRANTKSCAELYRIHSEVRLVVAMSIEVSIVTGYVLGKGPANFLHTCSLLNRVAHSER